jgi:hypothetical protein
MQGQAWNKILERALSFKCYLFILQEQETESRGEMNCGYQGKLSVLSLGLLAKSTEYRQITCSSSSRPDPRNQCPCGDQLVKVLLR